MNFFRPEIEQMAGYTPGEQPQAGKFIKLNTNENPYPASPAVAQAVQQVLDRGLERYPDPVGQAFRVRAGELLDVPPDWILCGNGSDDILTILTRALVPQGGCLRLPYPSYVLYKTLAKIQGARAEEVDFDDNWSIPESFGNGGVELAFLPNPNSPTGTMVDHQTILETADRLPCPLLIDEAYVDFADTSAIELVKQNPKVMVSRTLSKSYALAGLRFGFLVAQPTIIEQLMKVKDSYNVDALSIAAATAAINDQEWLQKNRARVIETRTRLQSELEQLGFSVIPSQANFVWCRHESASSELLYEQLKQSRILVRYMNYGNWQEGLRISVGTDEQIDACLAMLSSALQSN